jgi:hypothetical protein
VRAGVDLVPKPEAILFPCFHLSIDAREVRPDYDLDAYRRGEARTTEERFARSLLLELEAESDPARRKVIEAALYYGLDALRFGDVAPRYEHVGERA